MSTADFSILGGDFNFDPHVNKYRPITESETTLEDIMEIMVNTMGNILIPEKVIKTGLEKKFRNGFYC